LTWRRAREGIGDFGTSVVRACADDPTSASEVVQASGHNRFNRIESTMRRMIVGDRATSPASDLTMVELAFSRGAVAHVEAMWGARYAYDIRSEILCENGAVVVGGFAQTMLTVLRAGERRDDLYPGFLERYADAYVAELRDFVDGVFDRRPPAVTGDDGRRALAIAFAAVRSAATTRPVTPD